MYFTEYVRHDGCYESLCSLREGLGPILKCRVVLDSEGNYELIVRDYTTGKMVASKRCGDSPTVPATAKMQAQELAIKFIISEIREELPHIQGWGV